jgi:type IV secretion system protein VirD4
MTKNDVYGSAKWLSGELRAVPPGTPSIQIGLYKDILKTEIASTSLDRHLLSVAPTRSGKGTALIIPNLLQYPGSVVVIDPKGENAWLTAEYRRKHLNQKIVILDPWGEVNRRYCSVVGCENVEVSNYNPLSILDPKDLNYTDDLVYIAHSLITREGKSDTHWTDSARELLAGLISKVVEEDKDTASLPLVRKLLSRTQEGIKDMAVAADDLSNKGRGESIAARKLARFASINKETASVISTALTQTAFLDSPTLAKNLETNDFDFSDLVEGKTTIYLVLPIDKLEPYAAWLRLMVSLGIRTVSRNTKKLEYPVLFILDEFGTIGRHSVVANAYGLMASAQMRFWAFVQDITQLQRDYPAEWETFISNSEAVTFFNILDQTTADYISKLLGKTTATVGYRGYMQYFSRDLLQPSGIRTLDKDMGIMVNREHPLLFEKINYYEDAAMMEKLDRKDPYAPI